MVTFERFEYRDPAIRQALSVVEMRAVDYCETGCTSSPSVVGPREGMQLITVHLGLHKTGSTSIQVALQLIAHRGQLVVSRPAYSGPDLDPRWVARVRDLSRTSNIVVSDESLLGSPSDGYSDAIRRAQGIHGAFGDLPMKCIVYLRPQMEWLPSVYLQLVQQGSLSSPWDFWNSVSDHQNLRWSHLVAGLQTVFPQEGITVRPYAGSRDVVADFFKSAGLGEVPHVREGRTRENASIRAEHVPIIQALVSRTSGSEQDIRAIRVFFQSLAATHPSSHLSPFSQELQLEIARTFASDWTDLIEVVKPFDQSSADLLADCADSWSLAPRESVGSALSSPIVTDAMLGIVSQSVHDRFVAEGRPSVVRRALRKAMADPLGVPAAANRHLRTRRR